MESVSFPRKDRISPRYPPELPIVAYREDIIHSIRRHQVLILSGETGSGKTTQIPKLCLEAGRGTRGLIGCTQPRRIAALTVAARIAEELKDEELVACKIRFHESGGKQPLIKIMTDGILLAETRKNPLLTAYDTLIVDEAHERSLNIDILLGILRGLLKRREDLKVIVTSATLDTEKFSRAFSGAPVMEVSGRTYPVDIRYDASDEEADLTAPERAADAVSGLLHSTDRGDILVFLPTERDIHDCSALIRRECAAELEVLPLYARLPGSEQKKVFKKHEKRRCVVATNVAETSLTIDGIKYVVDSGLARISRYNPGTGTHGLPVDPISRASADQRAGRCGRTEDGVCIRLFSREDYDSRPLFTPPEIRRSNLAEVILNLIHLGIDDIESFPFIDPPTSSGIRDGFRTLREIGALEAKTKRLTPDGRLMTRLPLDPRLARVLIQAHREGCLGDVLPIAAALSLRDPRERPPEKEKNADRAHETFQDGDSDFLTWLNIWEGFRGSRGAGRLKRFCTQYFLSFRRMREWMDTHRQLTLIMEENSYRPRRLKAAASRENNGTWSARYSAIHRSLLSGFLSHVARKTAKGSYETIHGREAWIHPGSALAKPSWIVAAELIRTTRLWARAAAAIDPSWIETMGAHLLHRRLKDARWNKKAGTVLATEELKFHGFLIRGDRTVPCESGKAAKAIFIRSALVERDLPDTAHYPFLEKNQELLKRLRSMEEKLRRRDLVAGEVAMAAFYDAKLPMIHDLTGLDRFLKSKAEEALVMKEEDLLTGIINDEELTLFPDAADIGTETWELSYRFHPGSNEDGVTLKVPAGRLGNLGPDRPDWLIPGLLKDRVAALVRTLPKEYRRRLIPMAETVKKALEGMDSQGRDLPRALSDWFYKEKNITIPLEAWKIEDLPPHLRLRYSLIDHSGKELASSRDLSKLMESHSVNTNAVKDGEREDLQSWPEEDVPESLSIPGSGLFWPALVDEGERLSLRFLTDKNRAEILQAGGQARLAGMYWKKELRRFREELPLDRSMVPQHLGHPRDLEDALWNRVLLDLFGRLPVRKKEDWKALLRKAGAEIFSTAESYRNMMIAVFEVYKETRTVLERLTKERGRKPYVEERLKDLETLVPLDFPKRFPPSRWKDSPRWMRALGIRTRRGVADPGRDAKMEARWRPLRETLEAMLDELPPMASVEKRRALDEAETLLEELKVSLFAAGELRPLPGISESRLAARLNDIAHML